MPNHSFDANTFDNVSFDVEDDDSQIVTTFFRNIANRSGGTLRAY